MPVPNREAAIKGAVRAFGSDQWTLWPMSAELEQRLYHILDTRFDELFAAGRDGFVPRWIPLGREILITWQPKI